MEETRCEKSRRSPSVIINVVSLLGYSSVYIPEIVSWIVSTGVGYEITPGHHTTHFSTYSTLSMGTLRMSDHHV